MKKSRKENYSPYVQLEYELLESAAWTALSYEAQWVYIELKKQFNYSQGGYNNLVLSYKKVVWRMAKGTFSKRIKELIRYGFIRKVKQGGLLKNPNIYALSESWRDKSREVVDKEGKQAIILGHAKKRTYRKFRLGNLNKNKTQVYTTNLTGLHDEPEKASTGLQDEPEEASHRSTQ